MDGVGADTLELTEEIETELTKIQNTRPADVKIDIHVFHQATFLEVAIDNVIEAIRDEAIWVITNVPLTALRSNLALLIVNWPVAEAFGGTAWRQSMAADLGEVSRFSHAVKPGFLGRLHFFDDFLMGRREVVGFARVLDQIVQFPAELLSFVPGLLRKRARRSHELVTPRDDRAVLVAMRLQPVMTLEKRSARLFSVRSSNTTLGARRDCFVTSASPRDRADWP